MGAAVAGIAVGAFAARDGSRDLARLECLARLMAGTVARKKKKN
jgi:hypothetical protein